MAGNNGEPQPGGIREVARIAGVSVAPASFALNGQPTVVVRGTALPLVDTGVPAGPMVALVRPEAITVAAADESAEVGPLTGTVIATTFLGATSRVTMDLGDTTIMAAMATAEASTLSAGQRVTLTIRPSPVLVSADSPAASAG
jgi:putative spermidine/putrescine transport system ATP-binding protein